MLAKVRSAVGGRSSTDDNKESNLHTGAHNGLVIDVTESNFIAGLLPGNSSVFL